MDNFLLPVMRHTNTHTYSLSLSFNTTTHTHVDFLLVQLLAFTYCSSEHVTDKHCTLNARYATILRPPKNGYTEKVVNKNNEKSVSVIYFDQRLGAAHSKCWSK